MDVVLIGLTAVAGGLAVLVMHAGLRAAELEIRKLEGDVAFWSNTAMVLLEDNRRLSRVAGEAPHQVWLNLEEPGRLGVPQRAEALPAEGAPRRRPRGHRGEPRRDGVPARRPAVRPAPAPTRRREPGRLGQLAMAGGRPLCD